MTLIIPPGFGNAAFVFTGGAGTPAFVTTLGLDLSGFSGDFVAAANRAMAVYGEVLGPETWNALVLDRVTLSVGSDGPGGSVDSDLAPINMTRSGTFPPISMSAIARKVTNELGRRGRGRMFLPGVVNEAEVDPDGSIVTARKTSLNTALDLFYDVLLGGTPPAPPAPPVLFHSAAPADPTSITGLVTSDLVGWVRGRIR